MLQNAYFLAKIGADTAENEQHFAKILPTDALPTPAEIQRGGAKVIETPTGAVRRYFPDLAEAADCLSCTSWAG